MTPQELKNSILQLAIQGKLVEQRPEEGTGENQYEKISVERAELIQQKKFKWKKQPTLSENELPFDIPDTWKWVRLGDIISIESGKGLTSAQMVDGPIPVYGGNGITGYHNESYIHEETVVIGRVGFYCGSVHITEKESWVTDNAFITTYPQLSIDRGFLVHMLCHMNLGRNNNATAQPVVSGKKIYPLPFPIPPFAEQKRIVAKIEELLPYIDRYEQAWSKLEDFNNRFPTDMQKSILQMAIQGKLVGQRSEEGTGEELYRQIQAEKQKLINTGIIKNEKYLPEIAEDEMPFDIPENWKWTRLRSIVYNRGQETPAELFSYIDIGSIDNKKQRLNTEENLIEANNAPSRARKVVEMGDILYSTVRPYLHNMCIIDRQFTHRPIASTGFAAMTCYEGIYNKFLFFYLMSPAFDNYANDTENAKGVAYPAINDDRLYRAIVPLPPLAEQKRIVAKIEELLLLCEKLRNSCCNTA